MVGKLTSCMLHGATKKKKKKKIPWAAGKELEKER